jgi:hypothetical protein
VKINVRKVRSARLPRFCVVAIMCLNTPSAFAEITILKCGFSNLPEVYFTIYDDGTPVRIGVRPGVGSRGLLFRDPRNKTMVIIEQNLDGVPDTFTTIIDDMTGIHSRALLNPDGSVSSPTQGIGRCQVAPIR